MRPNTNRGLLAGASILALFGSASLASAAIAFTQDFSTTTATNPGPNLTLGTGSGSPTTDFVGDFTITSGTGSRIYLGTNATSGNDYFGVDFTFQATVTVPAGNSAWSIAFFGMGSSAATGGSGEPGGKNVLLALRNDGGTADYLEARDNGAGSGTNLGSLASTTSADGTHGLKMTWNSATKLATFFYDQENDGVFNGTNDKSFTVNGADNGFTGSDTQLILGGGNGLTFDNIVVTVPEPSVALLGGVGMLGLLRRRRS